MILNSNMRRKRRELDLTQKEVAAMSSIAQSYYAQIEGGKVKPSIGTLCAKVKVLGLQFNDVLEVK